MSEPDDNALLRQWREGDAKAGQILFRRHFDSIYSFFETKFSAEADELVQATFLACMRSREQFRGDSSFRTYLFTIARHELYRALTHRRRALEKVDFEVSSIAQLVTTPRSKLARNEEHQQLIDALQHLSVDQQTLLELHYWQDMGIVELAEIFDAEPGTIRVRLHRARKALGEHVERLAPREATETEDALDRWVRGYKPTLT